MYFTPIENEIQSFSVISPFSFFAGQICWHWSDTRWSSSGGTAFACLKRFVNFNGALRPCPWSFCIFWTSKLDNRRSKPSSQGLKSSVGFDVEKCEKPYLENSWSVLCFLLCVLFISLYIYIFEIRVRILIRKIFRVRFVLIFTYIYNYTCSRLWLSTRYFYYSRLSQLKD